MNAVNSIADYTPKSFPEVTEETQGSVAWLSTQNFGSVQFSEVDTLFALFQKAKLISQGIDEQTLKKAVVEAVRLMSSGLFPDFQKPAISVDEYGEFSFSIENSSGYLDIGVCGHGELSYHVRNDVNPDFTVFGDCDWNDTSVPDELVEGTVNLLKR